VKLSGVGQFRLERAARQQAYNIVRNAALKAGIAEGRPGPTF
jgi:hypothetical protein